MQVLFTAQYQWVWAIVLAAMLWYPVRQLIWTLSVRRARARQAADETVRERLRRRASVTSALLCFVFSYLYTASLMKGF